MAFTADRAIAIVGLAAILPDAPDATSFWNNVIHKCYSIIEVPPDRWSVADYYDPDPRVPDKTYSKIGGWVRGFEFDWKRFHIPPKVAAAMDQGQQWAVTIAADALADYGYPQRPLDTERTAVVLGTAMGGELHYKTHMRVVFPEFAHALEQVEEFEDLPPDIRQAILARWHEVIDQSIPPITEDSMPGELPNIVSGRVANVLGLRGPNFITDAACASSFAGVNAAIELLIQHHVDAVITGGVDRNMGISSYVKFCKIGALSGTGSRPFGDGADGFVMGEGAAAFLLKRLKDAERAGDKIYAVIRGVGGASDGKGKGITAPNPVGQQLAIRRAWENAGVDPATATLIEAHGTSTKVGDVVEVESLSSVFGGAPSHSIALGSVKSNIGHLKAGAGAAGLLKATLALHHKTLPPTLNAQRPNPDIDFERTPFYLSQETKAWPKANGIPRRCGVSAYGFGGTNFHVVLEEHVPGLIAQESRQFTGASIPRKPGDRPTQSPAPFRGILAMGADSPVALKDKLDDLVNRVQIGWTPQVAAPNPVDLRARERLVIDYGDHEELLDRLLKAQKAMSFDNPTAWRAFQAQGIFRGSGPQPGKVAFLFPGQGSQYVNMGRVLAGVSSVVADVFAEADKIMTPILGKPLTSYIFVDSSDPAALAQAEIDLMQTAITQPAMLTLDIAIYRLLEAFGFKPDMVMGHSLGEYAALIVSGVMPFADALEAAAARGSEMTKVSVEDNGAMAAVLAPYEFVVDTLKQIGGYIVPANINSHKQSVIGGLTQSVVRAVQVFESLGYKAVQLPVSHAFHTRIVAPASAPLRLVLDRLHIAPPKLPLVANVTGDFYPKTVDAIKDILQQQIASPVQWVKGLETLYDAGARMFVECGPKRALKGFADDVFEDKPDVSALLTAHPKTGELPTFNQALCGLYAAGYFAEAESAIVVQPETPKEAYSEPARRRYDRNEPPLGSVVISGSGLGLPGAEKPVMDPDNAMRILRGEQFIDLIPERFRKRMLSKRVTRLIKSEDGNGRFEPITDPADVIKLAGRPGRFDLAEEYGVPDKLVEALDITTQLAMAAGLDALREAGIPLVQTYRTTSTGKSLPDRWLLPESLRDETGVIFASAFPGGNRLADEFDRYYTYQNRLSQQAGLEDLRQYSNDPDALGEIDRRLAQLYDEMAREPYEFDRRFLFRVLAMGHSQFAEYIGARGPNTQVNAACASTTQAVALAEDWIRSGRCRRVIVIGADDVTSEHLMEWIGAGFLATGAAATDDRVEEAALPFDRRRHGTIIGMGTCALVVESEDAVRERGMRGIAELLTTETRNSAFHGTRLDVDHIAMVMDDLLIAAERRFGLKRQAIAPQMVFMSHETFTPARGGSASAEVAALRRTFGDAADEIVVANTKGFTGHPMGVGIEDVIALKILEHGIVPPVPNYKEVDPELGQLNLSRGGRYPVRYALHLAAGFGSQISLTLTRRIPGGLDRADDKAVHQRWLDAVSGYEGAETEVVKRVLRVKANGLPARSPVSSGWQYGTGPTVRALSEDGQTSAQGTLPARKARLSIEAVASPVSDRSQTSFQVEALVRPAPEPVKPLPVEEAAGDPVAQQILRIVSEQTGYPADMLELDLDLEADLGVDTVKQAETFVAIRNAFDIPRRDDLKLRDYPTLAHVINFVHEMRPDLATSPQPDQSIVAQTAPASPAPVGPQGIGDPVAAQVLHIVSEQTGYPEDILDLDLDLEADLGVDTVKQAETFVAIRNAFDIPRRDDLKLRDYPTLAHVIKYVHEMRPDLAASQPPPDQPIPAPAQSEAQPVSAPASAADPVAQQILRIVSDQTGYPADMLELDLDLEADLGVDTVKQAETFAAIRTAFDIPRRDDLKLRDYPTLAHVINFVHGMRPDLGQGVQTTTELPATGETKAESWMSRQVLGSLEEADRIPRRVPVPSLRPGLDLCKSTGVGLDENSRVIVALDTAGVGKTLIRKLKKRGVNVLTLDAAVAADVLDAQIHDWLAEGPIQGVYWLPALDVEPDLETLDLGAWHELTHYRVKNLFITMRALYDAVGAPGSFLMAATRMGGLHGYGLEGATAALGGAVTGFVKAYKRERSSALVKTVDFEADAEAGAVADRLIAETLTDLGVVEMGYFEDNRYGVTLVERPAANGGPGMTLNRDTVFVITGAAGSITSAITADLAAASGGTFYLLDMTPTPDRNDPHIGLFRADKEALKRKLIEDARASGERPTPVQIDRQIAAIERQEAALRAIEAIEVAGGTAYYYSTNLLDDKAVAAVVDDVHQHHGRIDVLIHAGGLEISHLLPDKDLAQLNLVFDVKSDGFFNLLRAAQGMPIGATVAFSSVAGRFGNGGQTDYSAANDLLCKLTSTLRRWRPETRGIVIDWTAWSGIGMASRGSIPKMMEMAGIDMLSPQSGIPTVRRELTAGEFRGEVVVGNRLGILMDEWDASGGLDTEKAARWLAERKPGLLMVGSLKASPLHGGLEVETVLDPTVQPFLHDHQLGGTPLLPGVMGIEMFAELASALAPGYTVAGVANVEFQAAFKFYRMEPQTLHLSIIAEPNGHGALIAHTVLRSVRQPTKAGTPLQVKVHFIGDVHLTKEPDSLDIQPRQFLVPSEEKMSITAERIYRLYFHGPAYQVLERAQVKTDEAIGLMAAALPPNSEPADAASLMAPRCIELCFQTAGLWEIVRKEVMALPTAIHSVRILRQPEAAGANQLFAVVRAINDGEEFDAEVVDENGTVYITMSGYRTVKLPGSVTLEGT